jgi:hypothetical protein
MVLIQSLQSNHFITPWISIAKLIHAKIQSLIFPIQNLHQSISLTPNFLEPVSKQQILLTSLFKRIQQLSIHKTSILNTKTLAGEW